MGDEKKKQKNSGMIYNGGDGDKNNTIILSVWGVVY